jgi:hypothetical protein
MEDMDGWDLGIGRKILVHAVPTSESMFRDSGRWTAKHIAQTVAIELFAADHLSFPSALDDFSI